MECGMRITPNLVKVIKVIILWIKNQAMESINGKMGGYTKETFKMIIEMGMDNFLKAINACLEDIGSMGSNLKCTLNNNFKQQNQLLAQLQVYN